LAGAAVEAGIWVLTVGVGDSDGLEIGGSSGVGGRGVLKAWRERIRES